MQVWRTVPDWRARRAVLTGRTIGVVPTMGALHKGHASLVERCRRENDIAVVTIFLNPAQFNDPNDLQRYPSTFEDDLRLLDRLSVDDVFAPDTAAMYPNGYRFRIEADQLTRVMEGIHRPGFLEGVMTIVMKLLELIRADRAYFGEKDFQQLRTVTEMAADFFLPTEIVPCETIRCVSGLAESSRNARLSPDGRRRASVLFRALTSGRTPEEAKAMIEAEGLNVEYVEEYWGRRFAAAFLEGVRLIDNVPVKEAGGSAAVS